MKVKVESEEWKVENWELKTENWKMKVKSEKWKFLIEVRFEISPFEGGLRGMTDKIIKQKNLRWLKMD